MEPSAYLFLSSVAATFEQVNNNRWAAFISNIKHRRKPHHDIHKAVDGCHLFKCQSHPSVNVGIELFQLQSIITDMDGRWLLTPAFRVVVYVSTPDGGASASGQQRRPNIPPHPELTKTKRFLRTKKEAPVLETFQKDSMKL